MMPHAVTIKHAHTNFFSNNGAPVCPSTVVFFCCLISKMMSVKGRVFLYKPKININFIKRGTIESYDLNQDRVMSPWL